MAAMQPIPVANPVVPQVLQIGPPKGIEVRDFLLKSDFSWFFIHLGYFELKDIILYMEIEAE